MFKNGITPSTFGTDWFLTIFSSGVPLSVTLRIYDAYFAEGPKILFRVALYILISLEKQLIDTPIDRLVDVIKKHCLELDEEEIIAKAVKVKITRRQIVQFQNEYENHPDEELLEFIR